MAGTRLMFAAAVGAAIVGLALASPAGAQEDSPDDTVSDTSDDASDDVLDEIRALIPEGDPGEYDLTEADEEFGQLVTLFGESTDVADFGTGSELTGPCGGFAYSYNSDGELLDAALDVGDDGPPVDLLDGGQAFTSGNPFKVDTRGVVVYYGFAPIEGEGPMDHDWTIKTSGISLDSGGDPNTEGENRNAGIVDLDNDLPIKFTAKVKVDGEMNSANLDSCIGKGHVEFQGNGLLDPVGIGALLVLGGGIFGLLFNARPAMTWKA